MRATPRHSTLAGPRRSTTTLLGLLTLSLATTTGCGNAADSEELDLSLRPAEAPTPTGFPLEITVVGDDVVLDWSGVALDGSVTVVRSTSPTMLAQLQAGQAGEWDEYPVDGGVSGYTDTGAANRSAATPTYYYAVVVDSNGGRGVSTMGMKISTAMAPGYNKLAVCMEGGPTRASDVVERLGDSVTGVWGWDAATQSYIHWSPAAGVGSDSDFALPLGSVFAAQVDGSTPAFQSLAGTVPADGEGFVVSGHPGYNWSTLPVGYDGPTSASYWVGQVGYWGMGRWSNLAQSASWYWSAEYPDFELEACRPHYTYLPDNACVGNEDCGADTFCYFVDAAACGDVAAGLCKARPIGCEGAPQAEVCGCDGVTYPSLCEAELAGATVASEGACVVDGCEGVVCQNGGTCNDPPGADSWECVCPEGWSGELCESTTECADIDAGSDVPQTLMGTLVGATDDYAPSCAFNGGGDLAYRFTAPAAGTYVFDTVGTDPLDTTISVYDACGGAEVACNDDVRHGQDLDSVVGRQLVAGQSVLIVVDGYDELTGDYVLNISLDVNDCAVDSCQNGGACIDGIAAFTCECPAGFAGALCQDVVDPNACPCLDPRTGPYAAVAAAIMGTPTACTTSPTSATGVVPSLGGVVDTVFVQDDGAGGMVCGSQFLSQIGIAPLPVTAPQAQSCVDAIEAATAAAGLTCAG